MLCSVTLHYVMLYHITLHYVLLYHIPLHYFLLRFVVLGYVKLYYIKLFKIIIHSLCWIDYITLYLPNISYFSINFYFQETRDVFTKLHFLCNSEIGPIRWSV
jgi:hypothetical protein